MQQQVMASNGSNLLNLGVVMLHRRVGRERWAGHLLASKCLVP